MADPDFPERVVKHRHSGTCELSRLLDAQQNANGQLSPSPWHVAGATSL